MFGAELETAEREVWFVVCELDERDADGGGFRTDRTAFSDIGSAQMMAEVYAGWSGVRSAWVEYGTRTETRTVGGKCW